VESFLITLAIIYLVSPLILGTILIVHHRRMGRIQDDIEVLYRRINGPGQPVAPVVSSPGEGMVPSAPVVEAPKPEPAAVEPEVVPPVVEPVQSPISEPAVAREMEQLAMEEVSGPCPVVEFIRRIGMLPPGTGEGMTRETILMQWWIPRLGGFLALLSALFFGVYINQNTSPLFKLLELVAVSVGTGCLGLYLERKYKALGGVRLVTGMIMLYLSSVAAYALPAVRVIENPLVGSVLQALVLAGICAEGYRRGSRGIVLLAFNFGYFLSLFMAWEGLREGALIAPALLFVAGVFLSSRSPFEVLKWVIVPGSFLVSLAYAGMTVLDEVLLPASISMQVYINLVFAGVGILHYTGRFGGRWPGRLLLSLGSTLALASAGLFFRVCYPADLELASLVLGSVMLAGAVTVWARGDCRFIVQLLFIKASFLIAVWAILHFAGDLRWMVLGLETVVLAGAARRSRKIAMELAVWAAAIVSFVFYLEAIKQPAAVYSFTWWMMTLYPGILLIAFSLLLKMLPGGGFSIRDVNRNWAYGLVPIVATILWHMVLLEGPAVPFEKAGSFVIILYASVGLSFAPFLERWMLLGCAGLAFVSGNLQFWDGPFSLIILLSLLVAGGGAVAVLGRRENRAAVAGENLVYPFILVSVALYVFQLLDNWVGQGMVAFALAIGILCLGLLQRVRHAGSWFFIPVLIFLLTEQPAVSAGIWSLASLGMGFAMLAIPAALPVIRGSMGWGLNKSVWALIGSVLFWAYVAFFGDPQASWISGQVVMGVLAVGLLLVSWKFLQPGVFAGGLLILMTQVLRHSFYLLLPTAYLPWKSEALGSSIFAYAFALTWLFCNPLQSGAVPQRSLKSLRKLSSLMTGLLIFGSSAVTFYYEELGWGSWYTPILAVTAFAMILLGLFRKDPILRQLGIAALCVPLVRLFVVDVQDVLHRIIAFAAASVLLTALGYLYHRLSEKLEEDS
jgi:hypothetical protein